MSDEKQQQQHQRAVLRQRFLAMLSALVEGQLLRIQMYEGALVTAKYRSMDNDVLNLHVHDLQTPIGAVPEALLRIDDISSIELTLADTKKQ